MANFSDNDIKQIEDLQQFFGVEGGIGNIIDNAAINKFAFCKPFRHPANAFASDAARESARMGAGGTGAGLNIPYGVSAVWEYQRPQGMDNASPYRHLDFLGYYHNAVAPLTVYFNDEKIKYSGSVGRQSFTASIAARAHDGQSVSLADMFSETERAQLYAILVITTIRGSYYARIATLSTILTNGGGGVTIDTHEAYNILSSTSTYNVTTATVSVIVGSIDSDGYNKTVSPRMYSLCYEAGAASVVKAVEYAQYNWYDGLSGSAQLNNVSVSGRTATPASITFSVAGNGYTGGYLYYRLHLIGASGLVNGQSELYPVPATWNVGNPPQTITASLAAYTWSYPPQRTMAMAVGVILFNSLANAQNNTDGYTVATANWNNV